MTELSMAADRTTIDQAPSEDLELMLKITNGLPDLLLQLGDEFSLASDSIALRRIIASNELDKRNLANRVTRPPGSR